MLLNQLPLQSRYNVARVGHPVWSTSEHLLAAQLDTIRGGNYQRGGGKGQRPKPIERPGDKSRTKLTGTQAYTLDEYRRRRNRNYEEVEREQVK